MRKARADAVGVVDFPRISACSSIEHFRNGERYHALMTPVAESLSNEDIQDLAAYFSSIGPLAGASGAERTARR